MGPNLMMQGKWRSLSEPRMSWSLMEKVKEPPSLVSTSTDLLSDCSSISVGSLDDELLDTPPVEKMVRFATTESMRFVPSISSLTKQERQAIWFTDEENDAMKEQAWCLAEQAAACEISSVSKTYMNARYRSATMDEHQVCEQLDDADFLLQNARELIEMAVTTSSSSSQDATASLRGLEDWLPASDLRDFRRDDSREAVPMVVYMSRFHRKQRKARGGGSATPATAMRTNSTATKELYSVARQYKEMSQSALILARLFAAADAMAAETIYEESDLLLLAAAQDAAEQR